MPSQRNIKLIIEYDGGPFCGWQSQQNGRSIQDEITDAIHKTTNIRINLTGAGRTDAGVHALGQVANFQIEHDLPAAQFREALNYYLPEQIRIISSEETTANFHARYDAVHRRYRYLVTEQPRSALHAARRWELGESINYDLLSKAATVVAGEHDFAPFCVVSSRKDDNTCSVRRSHWYRTGPLLIYEITGNRFLHGMVRSLVGAMINVSRVKSDENRLNLTLERFTDIIKSGTDERVQFSAPAHGLYLVSVAYE